MFARVAIVFMTGFFLLVVEYLVSTEYLVFEYFDNLISASVLASTQRLSLLPTFILHDSTVITTVQIAPSPFSSSCLTIP